MESDLRLDSNLIPLQVPSEDDEQLPPLGEMLPIRSNITPQIIEDLEVDLDLYEQVALVLLLYDNVDYALQQFKVKSAARNGRPGFSGLLSEWAQQQGNSMNWEEKFLEALCIIQNFLVVEKLGYRKDALEDLFLSGNPEAALNVDLMRKAFYVVCEKLSMEQEKRLLELVKEDLGDNSSPAFINNAEFLEMHFLYWISQHYIQVRNQTVNVKNITKHLKSMELYTIVDYLDSIVRRYQSHDEIPVSVNDGSLLDEEDNESSYENRANPAHSDVGSVFEENITICHEAYYEIDPRNMGFCVIINQKNFYKEPNPKLQNLLPDEDLENRVGTDIDRDRLSEAFGNFGFKVKIWEDLDHVNLLRSVDEAVHDLVEEKHSCFVLCVLSHGLLNAVYGANSIPVSVDEIHMKIQGKNCPKLINKPKIIIIQACQGQDKQDALVQRIHSSSDLAADGPTQLRTSPEISDSLICWSTVPGYASFRDRIKGTWFIQTLCDVLLESTTGIDLNDALLAVNGKLKGKVARIDHNERKTMQPVFSSTLCKKVYWPINMSARKTVAEIMAKRSLFEAYVDEYLRMEFHRNNV